jgi:hypothetical protein
MRSLRIIASGLCVAPFLGGVFLFAADALTAPSPVVVAIDTASARPPRPLLLGANQNFMTRPYGYLTPQVVELTRELRLNLIRYPAGGQSNTWDWEAANYMPAETIAAMRQAQRDVGFNAEKNESGIERMRRLIEKCNPNKALGVDGFMAFCAKMDPRPQPIWVANVLTGSPEMSAAWVAYNKRHGHPNELWELGNEHYLKSSRFKYPTAADYLREAEAHTKAMKAADPTIRVSVTAAEIHKLGSFQGAALAGKDADALAWNEGLAKGRFYDAINVHDYFPITEAQTRSATQDAMFRFMMARIPTQFPILIDYYRQTFGPDVRIWVSEWNISPLYKRYGDPAMRRARPLHIIKSLAHSLYVADWLLTATDYPDVIELASIHVLAAGYPRGLFGAELPEERNLGKPFVRTPPFHAIRMLGEAWLGSDATGTPALTGVETMTGALELEGRPFPALVVRAFMKGNQPQALAVINKSAEPRSLKVTVDGRPLASQAALETLTAPEPLEDWGKPTTESEDQWRPKISLETRSVGADEIVAPAHSLSVIRFVARRTP